MTEQYRLSEKILTVAEINKAILLLENVEAESELEIDEKYHIKRYVTKNTVVYVHNNGDKIFKICRYERKGEREK